MNLARYFFFALPLTSGNIIVAINGMKVSTFLVQANYVFSKMS